MKKRTFRKGQIKKINKLKDMEFNEKLFNRIRAELEKSGAKVSLLARAEKNKVDYTILAKWKTGRKWEIVGIEEDNIKE